MLLALADHERDGVLMVSADETIPFYNGIAAAMLHLPTLAERLSLATLRTFVRIIGEDVKPRGIEILPLAPALSACVPMSSSLMCEHLDDGSRGRFEMTSLPFSSPRGEFIGVGNYLAANAD